MIQVTWTQPKMCCICKAWVMSGWQQPRQCPGGYCLDQYCDDCGKANGAMSEDEPNSKRRAGPAKVRVTTEPSPLEQWTIDMEDQDANED